jgi:hypothetical protein
LGDFLVDLGVAPEDAAGAGVEEGAEAGGEDEPFEPLLD